MRTKVNKIFQKARDEKRAIPAFNFDNMDMLKGIQEAADEMQYPVMAMCTESASKFMGSDYATVIVKHAEAKSKFIIPHWDHGFDKKTVLDMIDNQWTSVMLDRSLDPFEKNLSDTIEVVKYAKKHDVYVESEIGHVGGKEDDNESKTKSYTTVEEAVSFATKTGIDLLAIAVGTAHGIYKGKVELQIDRIIEIQKALPNTFIVLHGCSGVPDDQVKSAIDAGIVKVNVGTELKQAYANAVREWLIENPEGYDARKFGRQGIDAVKAKAIEKIKLIGRLN